MTWFNPFEGGSGDGSSTAYATSLVLELNPETYVLTATLKNKNGDTLGTSQTIDLPLETMVVSGRYNSNTKMVILVLSNGQEISFSVADLINGLQSEITIDNKLNVQLIDGLGTAALKDVPVSGNASATQVVMGNDTRLTDSRPASDVSAWAKELTKPAYSYSEISNTPTVDTVPTSGSNNLVSSGGVYTVLGNKVDKVQGQGLSTEDYTTEEKTKLSGIEAEANKTIVDSALDGTSTNPVQNKVVADKFTEIENSHVELTQAEYNALGNEKYTDNKEYFITDAAPDDLTYIYGFHIDPDESDPADCVTYLADAVGMTPAAMGTTAFNYGSWENAFFMPKPCMLKYDGTVDYYLDPNDYSKKADGTASDIADLSYGGNAMMEFPLIWYKFEQGIANGEGYFYVSNKRVDDTYHCWSNYDSDNNIIDHFYMAIYNGVTYDEKMRSISGITLTPWSTTAYSASATYAVGDKVNYNGRMWKCTTAVETAEAFDPEKWEQFAFNGNITGTEEIAQASANDTTAKPEWYIDLWADRVLITGLLYLMGKSLDLQGTFGQGISTGSQAAKEAYVTGVLNDKGLFYGSTTATTVAVKVFGIENFWALVWRRMAGLIGISTGYAYKLTHGTVDGSTATAFATTSTGYLTKTITKPSSEYVKQMTFGKHGLLPSVTANGANSAKYFCDYFYTGTGFALVGGASAASSSCGLYVFLSTAVGVRHWYVAAALSCKPLA